MCQLPLSDANQRPTIDTVLLFFCFDLEHFSDTNLNLQNFKKQHFHYIYMYVCVFFKINKSRYDLTYCQELL